MFPADTIMVAFATDIETAGELPVKHALMSIGVAVLALRASTKVPVVVLTKRFDCFRRGTRRFSQRCASTYLTHANDESADPLWLGWAARRAASEAIGYADLHTYPRVASFAYEGGDCEHPPSETPVGSCLVCCNEIAREHSCYAGWLSLRAAVATACAERGIAFRQVTDNGGFDHGWLLSLASVTCSCPPSYLEQTAPGVFSSYVSTQETDLQLSSFIQGWCLGKGIVIPRGRLDLDQLRALLAVYGDVILPVCPAEHTHSPDDDATVIAWDYLVCQSLIVDQPAFGH
jgi:hypothetical protein